MEKECVGCLNIKYPHWPFEHSSFDGKKKGNFIDTEGCGLTQGDYFLEIFYCPVCGKKI